MSLPAGSRLGPYEILEWIGAGGMGEVYRARDPRLGRDVAVKVIPEALAVDPSRVRRFEQEARAAGQLNHPNILAVYDVGVHGNRPYIVSELLDGRPLREVLREGPLPRRAALNYARQLVEGLSIAHEKGIVHRDVKPDNLFVTTDDRLKLLDFGLAKLTAQETAAGAGITDTAVGSIVGTAAYMSPEQVRGEAIDARSDLFSVGAILFEMLATRSAFARETAAETMTAVLKDQPELPLGISPGLEGIVSRCLAKLPDARFQSARDLAFALDVLSETGTHTTAAVAARRWKPYALGVAAVGALAVLASIWRGASAVPYQENPLASAKFTPLTDWAGTEALAEISPDGRFATFLADRDGQFDIWLTQIGTGDFRNLTPDIPPMSAPGAVLRNFGFSDDGSEIWFSLSGRPGDRKLKMPLLGGAPRPFLGEKDVTPSWSPDGSRVVYFNNKEGGGDPMFVADRSGADGHQILAPEKGVLHNHNPVWSLDGEWIYFVRGVEPSTQMDIWRIRPNGGVPERMTMQQQAVNYLAPIDARTLLFVARASDRSGPWLWALDVDSTAVRRVSSGLEEYTSLAGSRDGHRIVTTIARPTSSLWTVPIRAAQTDGRTVEQYPLTALRATAPRLGGGALFYLSTRGADISLWRDYEGKGQEIWKGQERSLSDPPAISPDGRRVALAVRKGESRHLIVMAADGTDVKTVAPSIEIEGTPGAGAIDWSPEGKWIVAGARGADGPGLYKIPLNGGTPIRLVAGHAVNPQWSPADGLIIYAGPFVDGQVPLLAVRPDGTQVPFPSVRVREGGYRFLPNGRGVVFLPLVRSLDFWLLDLASGKQRQLTRLNDRGRLQTFDITPDGTHIVFDRFQENSDIVLIDR